MTNIDKRKWSNSDDSRDKVWLFWRNAARSADTCWIKIKIIICNVEVIKWFQLWKVDLTGGALHLQQGQIMCKEQGREESKLVKKWVQKMLLRCALRTGYEREILIGGRKFHSRTNLLRYECCELLEERWHGVSLVNVDNIVELLEKDT